MKRRTFFSAGATGALSLAGCSGKRVISQAEHTPMKLTRSASKPVGTMPSGTLGNTGIRISKFGFGSHMRPDMRAYEKEREWIIREAHELGMNFYDIYDHEHRIYQYEPMGRYLHPIRHEVSVSIALLPYEGRTLEQEFERDLRLLKRDRIDLVRCHAWRKSDDPKVLAGQGNQPFSWWDFLFKMKEQGKIRAVGVPIHRPSDLEDTLRELPLDFVILPYNFYHNWYALEPHDFDGLMATLQARGIGVITMKPQLGDRLAKPFRNIAASLPEGAGITLPTTNLRYIINSSAASSIDCTICGMFNPDHLYQNVTAFYHPELSTEERTLLAKLRKVARVEGVTDLHPMEYYRFLEEWAPDDWDDRDLFGTA